MEKYQTLADLELAISKLKKRFRIFKINGYTMCIRLNPRCYIDTLPEILLSGYWLYADSTDIGLIIINSKEYLDYVKTLEISLLGK